jgi:tetratricopeptide (TPR) repeat protein
MSPEPMPEVAESSETVGMRQPVTDDTSALLQDAISAYRAGKADQVERLCRRILTLQPEHVASLQILGAVAARTGRLPLGIQLVQKAVRLQPDGASAHIQLGNLLRHEGRPLEAVEELQTALRLQPNSAEAHNDLGLIYLHEGRFSEAAASFGRAIEIKPTLAIAHYNRAIAFEEEGRFGEAAACLRETVALRPELAEAHAELGSLLNADGHFRAAIDCFRRATALKPGSVFALICEARGLELDSEPAAAEEAVRRVIALDPQNSDAYRFLGDILMQQGRFDEAAASFDLAIAVNKRQVAAYGDLAHVRRLKETDRPLITRMLRKLRSEAPLSVGEATTLHFALGKAYDDLGEYGDAIRHFDEGNRLKRQFSTPYDEAAHAVLVDRVIARFTLGLFSRNAKLASDWDGALLVLGMPRSGTTLVEQILSSHPDVAAGGELAFWGERAADFGVDRDGCIDPAWVSQTAPDYRSALTDFSATARRITDKMPHNFHYAGLVHAVFPNARIIHCRRHPVDTCLSIYFQNFGRRMDFAYDRGDLLAFYRQYQRLMAHWRKVLPADRFLEIQYEELVADREPWTRKMIEFCGLEWDDACLHSESNRRPLRTASVWQARQPVYQTSVARWRHYEPWLGCLRELLSDADR